VYHGIALAEFTLRQEHGTYRLCFGRIHPDKGVAEAIAVAQRAPMPLYIAGIIQDKDYYKREVVPHLDGERVRYLGSVGPEQRDRLLGGAYALLHLINFSQERMVDHYINVYEEVLRMEATKAAPASPTFEQRPWGSYTVLDEGHHYKVKRLEILPGKRLSYQKHTQRAEHWMVVQGTARVTLEGREITVETGGTTEVPLGAAHRIANLESELLVLIEIQRGSYLGEDDIIRLQDDYGRAPDAVQT
jgi:mannose-6-phosphate isomerase